MNLLSDFRRLLPLLTTLVAAVLFLNVLSTDAHGQPGRVDQSFRAGLEQLGGDIYVAEGQADGKIIVGGLFQFVGDGTRINIARISADGSNDAGFDPGEGTNNQVSAVAIQPDGKIIAAGYFSLFNRQPVGGIVRLNPNGTIDPTFTASGVSGVGQAIGVLALAIQPDGKILVGGSFTNFNGAAATKLVRLNSDGTRDDTFDASVIGAEERVTTIKLLPTGKIYIATNFFLQGDPRGRIRRLNGDGLVDGSFNAAQINGPLSAVAIQADGEILLGTSLGFGTFGVSLLRLHEDGSVDAGFNTTSNAVVNSIVIEPDGKIVVGGQFDHWNDTPRSRLARLNSDGSVDPTFTPGSAVVHAVKAIVRLSDGRYMVGAIDTQSGNPAVSRLTRHNADGTLDMSFTTKVKIWSFADVIRVQPDGKILVGGEFTFVNGEPRRFLVRLNSSGTLDTSFNVDPNGPVLAISIQPDGKIVIGGTFQSVNGVSRSRIARLDSNGSVDASFDPGSGIGGGFPTVPSVNAIVPVADGKFLIGGSFLSYNGTERRGMARINLNGSLDTTFLNPAITGGSEIVRNILPQPDGKIVIGGNFVFINGVRRTGLARLESNGVLDVPFNSGTGLNNSVHAAALQPDGKILIGGIFEVINGVTRNYIARLNSDGSLDDTFNIGTGFSGGAGFAYVDDIVLQADGKVLVGGNFTFYNGTSANYFIRLTASGAVDSSFNFGTGSNFRISTIAQQANGDILIGGLLSYVQGYFHGGIARLRNSVSRTPFDFDGDGKTDIGIFRPTGGEWWVNRSSTGATFALQFGSSTDVITPADYTGDGRVDIAFFRPSSGEWYVLRSEDFSFFALPFGANGDVPVPADYDADGKADFAVFRPTSSTWFISQSSGAPTRIEQFGAAGDQPVVADYDGDGRADVGVFRNSAGAAQWWINRSTAGLLALQFGSATDKPVQGDYTGDGKADVAIWQPSTGEWFIVRSEDSSFYGFPFGVGGDVVAPGDYDGDGKFDATVFRPASATWFIARTTSGTQIVQFGANGDRPVANAFVP